MTFQQAKLASNIDPSLCAFYSVKNKAEGGRNDQTRKKLFVKLDCLCTEGVGQCWMPITKIDRPLNKKVST